MVYGVPDLGAKSAFLVSDGEAQKGKSWPAAATAKKEPTKHAARSTN